MEWFFVVVPLVIASGAIIFALRYGNDYKRIMKFIEQQGGEDIDIDWSPLSHGTIAGQFIRIYEVRYRDKQGYLHKAYCQFDSGAEARFTVNLIGNKTEYPCIGPDFLEVVKAEHQRSREELETARKKQSEN